MATAEKVKVEVTADGELRLRLPEDALERFRESGQALVKREGGNVFISPVSRPKLIAELATPEERARAFDAWIERFKDDNAPALSDEAISRDSIYD